MIKLKNNSVKNYTLLARGEGGFVSVETKLGKNRVANLFLKKSDWPKGGHTEHTDQVEFVADKLGITDHKCEFCQIERLPEAHVKLINQIFQGE